ncbi:MAG TPA: PIG-L family deacetylase [Caldilineaceae bacterium]|nr:PIG-L family deacetylase [Caldilineaceae bacterium]
MNYTPARAMAIVAHPDDIEFSCAGTLARWIKEGATVSYVLVTSGDVGIADLSLTREEAMAIREKEQQAAADAIGVQEVIFLRERDGMVENTMALRKRLVREIRRFKPEAVVVIDPTVLWAGEGYINHPDHRAAGMAAVDAIFPAAGQPHLFQELREEGLEAHKVRKVYAMNWGEGDKSTTYINISDTIDLKIAALREHKSQLNEWDPTEMVKNWSAQAAKGLEMSHAETFRVVTLESDENWAKLQEGKAKAT